MRSSGCVAWPALVLPLLLVAGSLIAPVAAQGTDRVERALNELDQRFAHAVAIVPLDGEVFLAAGGRVGEEMAFDTWQLVPLGEASRFFLDAALARAMTTGALAVTEPVITGDGSGEPELRLGDLSEFLSSSWPSLPGYDRFAEDATGFRPVAEVVAAHGFVAEDIPNFASSRTLQVALAQHTLERVTAKRWPELLEESAKEFGMQAVVDLTSSAPGRPVAWGRRADGSGYPLRMHEVPAAGNVACVVDDLVPLARHCVRDVLADAEREPGTVRIAARFDDEFEERFGVSTFRFRSDWCGATLVIEVLPEQRLAIVVFAARERGDWLPPLRDALFAAAIGRDPVEVEPQARFGGRGAPQRSTLQGRYVGTVSVDGRPVEVELTTGTRLFGLLAPRARARGAEPSAEAFASGRRAWATIPLPQEGGAELAVQIRLAVRGESDDPEELGGVAWVERTLPDGLFVERLPQRVLLRRTKTK